MDRKVGQLHVSAAVVEVPKRLRDEQHNTPFEGSLERSIGTELHWDGFEGRMYWRHSLHLVHGFVGCLPVGKFAPEPHLHAQAGPLHFAWGQ